MATPIQAPTEEMSPPPPASSSPGGIAISPTTEDIPSPPAQSPPSSSPPIGAPPPTSPDPPPPPKTFPPPPPSVPPPNPTSPDLSPPPPLESSPPPPLQPSVPPPKTFPPPPAFAPPLRSPPPPPSVPPPNPTSPDLSPPPPLESSPPPPLQPDRQPPSRPSVPPPKIPRPPAQSSPPPPPSVPPPRPSSSPSPSERPAHSPPPGSEHSVHSSPPPSPSKETPQPPKLSPVPLPSVVSPPSTSSVQGSDNSSDSGIGAAAVVGVSIGVAIVLLGLIVVVVCCLKRRKKRLPTIGGGIVMPSLMDSSRSDSALLKTQSSAPLVGNRSSNRTFFSQSEPGGFGQSKELFSYEELVKATNGFSDENLLGEGGFGRVYKGVLPDGRVVAVKQLKIGGGQGDREFKAEVETISRVHHRNLLSLVGYCISDNRRLLIYDYVPNNNLYFHLHGTPGLDWATRVKISAGAARGLAYLHEDCHPRIIHRDIKSANILLENNFHALVSDFGLAKLALDCNTHITTRVMGTFGYMAPEYASSGKLTEKSDVFSFGVVLLELITGRKPVDTSQPLGDEGLVEWSRPLLSHAIETQEFKALADPKLGGNYVGAEMFRMIEAAAACIRHSAAKRPRMSQIVRAFDSLAEEEDLTNGMRLGESEIINSAQLSAEVRLFRRMAFGSQNYSTEFVTRSSYNSRDENVYIS